MTDLPASDDRTPTTRHRRRGAPGRGLVLSLAIALAWATPSLALNPFSTRESTTESGNDLAFGCCTDPGVINYGRQINFGPLAEGTEITTQYRFWGVVFGHGATPTANATVIRTDYSRSPASCRRVLNGEPTFSGPEFFAFVDSLQNRWAKVKRVGASVGYADRISSCFLAAYDSAGNMLEVTYNGEIGFQFLKIERASSDICMVLVGDCQSTTINCNPDPAGSALNCLSFSLPISTQSALPDTIHMPNPPTLATAVPGVSPVGMVAMGLMMAAAAGIWTLKRRRALET